MKAWRKHNMIQADKIAALEEEIKYYNFSEVDTTELEKKLSQEKNFRITHRQAKTFFAPEVPTPSTILYTLFLRVGLPTPPEFKEAFMEHVRKMQNDSITATNTPISLPSQ